MKNQVAQVRDMLERFTPGEISACLDAQIHSGCNECMSADDETFTTSLLTKAGYISGLVEQGYTINDAFRKLGQQMRQLSSGTGNTPPAKLRSFTTALKPG